MPSLGLHSSFQPGPSTTTHLLWPRLATEHVVLADCRDENNVYLSQMAYFTNTPGPTPVDVSVVATPPGQLSVWVSMTTESLFTISGVKFIAKIGPKVAEGKYAGSGNNGYDGDFSCWQWYKQNSYTYGNTTCSQVYDCDRRPKPAVLPTPLPTGVPAPSQNSTSTTDSTSQGELSFGALIAIVVGAVAAFLIALIAGFLIWRAVRKGSDKPDPFLDFVSKWCCCGLGRRKAAELPGGNAVPPKPEKKPRCPSELHEMDGTFWAELPGGPIAPQELGGKESRRIAWELESPIIKLPPGAMLGKTRHTRQFSWMPGDDERKNRDNIASRISSGADTTL